MTRLLYLCDWLPPDFGAVGQYSLQFAREHARDGQDVVLAGLSSRGDSVEQEDFGAGRLTIMKFKADSYDRSRFVERTLWTLRSNLKILWRTRGHLCTVDEVKFTGSPPFMLHCIAPLNLVLRRRLVYRITDFHPECLMASMERVPLSLRLLHRLTVAWRRTMDEFEVLGEDQRRRLLEIGINADRIRMKRDTSPVRIGQGTQPLERPSPLDGHVILLYSGNFGVAHDHLTFVEGYQQHHRTGSGRVGLWLNAVGAKADMVEATLVAAQVPVYRSKPVPLEQLSRLLVTPDAHLITLCDSFVGFVMPSKVYGCLESRRNILYVGSPDSDIHLVCSEACPGYRRVDVGDVQGVATALEDLADQPWLAGPLGGRADQPQPALAVHRAMKTFGSAARIQRLANSGVNEWDS